MPKLSFLRITSFKAVLMIAVVSGSILLSPASAFAKSCQESAVAPRTVPQSLWGELQSVGVAQDATNYNGNQRSDTRYPLTTSIDIENGYVFLAAYFGFQIWDVRSTPEAPVKLGVADGWNGAFVSWIPGSSEVDKVVFAIDAPAGDDSLAAVGGVNPVGFSIWNTSNKNAPTILYQDAPSKQMDQVFAATINGRAYGFAAVWTGDAGVFAYDMTAARQYNRCLEDRTNNVTNCPGVYLGRVFNGSSQYIHGMQFGQRYFLVRSAGKNPPRSVDIVDVTNPSSPVPVTQGFAGTFTAGVAMWSQGSNAYLAVRTANKVNILDVTTCLTSGCSSLPAPIAIVPVAPVPESDLWKSLDFSRSGSTPMLFVGNLDECHSGESLAHSEYVLDVSNPSSPRDITPAGTLNDLGETIDYWSWYYSDTVRGFSTTAPRGGKFNGSYLYRADLALFDVHKWTGGGSAPPVANFTWAPSDIYTGDQVTFSDTSQGNVTARTWSFQDGSPSGGSASPVGVTFGSAGNKSVSLSVSNAFGSDVKTKTVTVINPQPAVANVTVVPANPVTCSQVTFTANGATGRAPLTLSWEVRDAGNVVKKTGTGNPLVWDTSAGVSVPPGTYTGTVTVTNGTVPATASANVTLTAPPALPTVGSFPAVTNDPFTAGTVSFHVNVPGATQWSWNFGDGQSSGWISDPVTGPNPVHTYTSIGQRNVTVSVRNCIDTVGVTSPALPVNITQIAPLTITFQAQGCFGFCAFGVSQQISFDVEVAGNPDQVQFDWDGNGSYEDVRPGSQFTAPTTVTHSYSTAGQYTPKAQVVRGVEAVSVPHGTITISGSTPPPPTKTITISGPGSGAPNAALTFTASASNCTPSASGWTWSPGGGTISGASNQSQVTIAWSSVGTKTVTATNTGCTATTGTKSLSISSGNPNPGGLAANFTVTPASPSPGQAVSFDAGPSTGGPTIFQWTFGDGQTASNTTATVSHTFQAAGSYPVKLEVSKPDVSCPFGLCTATTTKTVTVAGGTPPVVASFDSPFCIADFAGVRCEGNVGEAVSFTSTTANATSHFWSFGDGGTASGAQVSHTWTAAGAYPVQLTVSDGRTSSSVSRTFTITGPTVIQKKASILPLIAQTRGALVQSSDLYLLNPATSAIDVTLTFLRRGSPEANPPKVTKTVQSGATLYVADVLREMFDRENIAGFVTVTAETGNVEPIITSFNTTVLNGSEFGQTIPGSSLSTTGSAAGTTGAAQVQSLVGLNENSERLAYFGVSNPTLDEASFSVKFIDNDGNQIGSLHDFAVAPRGQRQFQPKDIREIYGVNNQDDYRIEIRSTNSQLFPFGSNLRLGSSDPSFVGASAAAGAKVYLLGVLSTPGINHTLWQSDIVIANTANEVVLTDMTFTGAGSATQSTQPVHLTLQPGETRRLSDAIGQTWGIRNTVGVVTLESNALGGVFPTVQGESYENTNPNKRFGQSLPAVTEAQAAGTGASQFLAGLRQDAKNRSTLWIFNPGSQMAQYDVVYLSLTGQELGRIKDVFLPAGKMQQLSPAQHKLPAAGVADGFTVRVLVKGGKILSAAQVVKNATNDPAYIQGVTR